MIITYAYSVFIGALLATFVGVGIAAFYPSPTYPAMPQELKTVFPADQSKEATFSAHQIEVQQNFEKRQEAFQNENKLYNRNVSIFSLAAAIAILAISLVLLRFSPVIADGLVVGGVLTLLYSSIRGFESGDSKFRFVVVTISLILSLLLGYLKFVRSEVSKK